MKTINKNKKTKITFVLVGFVATIVLTGTRNARADTWTRKADMPTARSGPRSEVVNGKIYVIGGIYADRQKVEAYDPATNTWATKADMPTPSRILFATGVVNGKIYVIGGEGSLGLNARATVEAYDPATDTWTRKGNMPTPRTRSAASVVEGKIYVIGGAGGGGDLYPEMSTVEAYDPATDTWTRKADMPSARELLSTSVVGGKIYAIGGQQENSVFRGVFSTVEMYDPATDTWAKRADMPLPRKVHRACVLNDLIYVFGGRNIIGGWPQSTLFQYDPAVDAWVVREDMPYEVATQAVSTVEGRIYLIGGSSTYPPSQVLSTVWEYDPGLPVASPDFNGDGLVDIKDLVRLIESWGQDDPIVDIAPPPFGDGIVDALDLELLMSYWEQPVDDPTLIAHWALDEAEGNIAVDSVSEDGYSDGYVFGDPLWQPDGGQVNGAIQLDGVDDYIITSPVLNPADGPFSALAWIKGGAVGQAIISEPGGANWLSTDPLEGYLMTELASDGQSGAPLLSETTIDDGDWHRIGFVWDGSSRMLYVDSIAVPQDTQDGLKSSSNGLYIGTGKSMESGTYWSGLIDDVRLYNRAVSP
jgi:N-acetylneuraminic acid mutarotase